MTVEPASPNRILISVLSDIMTSQADGQDVQKYRVQQNNQQMPEQVSNQTIEKANQHKTASIGVEYMRI